MLKISYMCPTNLSFDVGSGTWYQLPWCLHKPGKCSEGGKDIWQSSRSIPQGIESLPKPCCGRCLVQSFLVRSWFSWLLVWFRCSGLQCVVKVCMSDSKEKLFPRILTRLCHLMFTSVACLLQVLLWSAVQCQIMSMSTQLPTFSKLIALDLFDDMRFCERGKIPIPSKYISDCSLHTDLLLTWFIL